MLRAYGATTSRKNAARSSPVSSRAATSSRRLPTVKVASPAARRLRTQLTEKRTDVENAADDRVEEADETRRFGWNWDAHTLPN